MKALKIIKDILLAIAVVLYVSALIASIATIKNSANSSILTTLVYNSNTVTLLPILGIFLTYAKNDAAKRVGNGLLLGSFTLNLIYAILAIMSALDSTTPQTIVAPILIIIACFVILLHYLFVFICYTKNQNAPKTSNNSNNIALLREWKSLLDENIITNEEFTQKKSELLELNNNQNKE